MCGLCVGEGESVLHQGESGQVDVIGEVDEIGVEVGEYMGDVMILEGVQQRFVVDEGHAWLSHFQGFHEDQKNIEAVLVSLGGHSQPLDDHAVRVISS